MNRTNQVLFLVALVGLLAVLGTGLHVLAGPVVAAVYGVLALAALLVGAGRARAAQAARRRAAGRTCSCCTSTQFDPVKVV